MSVRGRSAGFTLVELAIVLGILGLLLGIVLVPLATQYELRQYRSQERDMLEVRRALLGFAAVNGRLPCPDTDGDGAENFNTAPPATVCTNVADELPYGTLGLPPADAWGRLRLYEVDADFVQTSAPGTPAPVANAMDLGDAADLVVRRRQENKTTVDLADTPEGAVAVVVSVGDNGFGGNTVDGNAVAGAPVAAAVDEPENTDADGAFVTRVRTGDAAAAACSDTVAGTPFCEFDDVVMWIPKSVLVTRMIEAGRLP